MTDTVLAYLDWGRWVAACPHCEDARLVYPVHPKTGAPLGTRLSSDTCFNGHTFNITMPDPTLEQALVDAVAPRPEADRHWYPDGLPLAEANGWQTGQTPEELEAENSGFAARRAAPPAAREDALRDLLAQHGLTVAPDGTVTGNIRETP